MIWGLLSTCRPTHVLTGAICLFPGLTVCVCSSVLTHWSVNPQTEPMASVSLAAAALHSFILVAAQLFSSRTIWRGSARRPSSGFCFKRSLNVPSHLLLLSPLLAAQDSKVKGEKQQLAMCISTKDQQQSTRKPPRPTVDTVKYSQL